MNNQAFTIKKNYGALCFDVNHQQKNNSGSTPSQSGHSLPEYDAFCFDIDHHEENNSGRTISHFDHSLLEYESFYFDLLIDPPPIVKMSNSYHEEFTDELVRIVSPSEYDHFYFDIEEFSKIDPLVSFPFGNKDKLFDPGILIINRVYSKISHILPLNDFSPISFSSDLLFLSDPSEIETLLSFPSGNKDKVSIPRYSLSMEFALSREIFTPA
nr:hypothetical protein [Tanacetum cinerariifolium]